jgi:hypothetical protein
MILKDTDVLWEEGWNAYWSAKTIANCPYVPASEEAESWMGGYSSALDAAEEDKDMFYNRYG